MPRWVFGIVFLIAPTFALASAVCASGTLAVARRALKQELPEIGGKAAELELSEHERRNLLRDGN